MTQLLHTPPTRNMEIATQVRAVAFTLAELDHKNSPAPPNTRHFGEFQRAAAQKPSPEVEADKQVMEITNSKPAEIIHHCHQVVVKSGDTFDSTHNEADQRDVSPETNKAYGESAGGVEAARPKFNGEHMVNSVVNPGVQLPVYFCPLSFSNSLPACCAVALVCIGVFAMNIAEAPAQTLSDDELAEGWVQLFDGETLFGWKPAVKANWKVADGAIVVDDGEVGLLCTTAQFGDYVLKLEFQADEKTNSGIFLHAAVQPKNPTVDCYELNIAAEGVSPFTTGSLVGRKKVASTEAAKDIPADGWSSFEVRVEGERISIALNGIQVLQYDDPRPLRRGHIGLQHNKGRVAIRNIKLKPLGTKPIFNGKDLTGWREDFQGGSKFTVTDAGDLNVRDGKGQLETDGKYGDFVLQLECISHSEDLNSGIFFRCIPGEKMNGYESQIHNGFIDGDRTKPKDCGTGGIFRRQNARRVVADDQKWFHKTIIADRSHMAVWVNGFQVSDWTDDRQPDANPRRGLRTEAGTIQIQGHDPTTNLSFRNLRIVELTERDQPD